MLLLPAFVNKSGRAICSPAPARDSSGAVGELFPAHTPSGEQPPWPGSHRRQGAVVSLRVLCTSGGIAPAGQSEVPSLCGGLQGSL